MKRPGCLISSRTGAGVVREYGPFQGPTRVLVSSSGLRGRDSPVSLPKEAGDLVYMGY